jgi:hypothetical protein
MTKREEAEVAAEERLFVSERQRGQLDPGGSTRHEIALLSPEGCIGAEIGVDTGQLSERFLKLDHFSSFHSVDKWDDREHSERQYWAVTEKLMSYPRSRVWRMTAQRWAKLVPDQMFGFIYIDCYAHTGQDKGEVLRELWPKLADGGIFSGDDYDQRVWPRTYQRVNEFAQRVGRECNVNDHFGGELRVDGHPSWWMRK